MIFRQAPHQTGLASHVELAETEFDGAADSRPLPLDERVKRKLRARHAGPRQLRQHPRRHGRHRTHGPGSLLRGRPRRLRLNEPVRRRRRGGVLRQGGHRRVDVVLFPGKWEQFLAPIPENERDGETITLLPDATLSAHHASDDFALAFARIENHYFVNRGFFSDDQLIREAHRLHGIPGVIVPDAGHAFSDPGIVHHLVEATDDFGAR